VQKGCPWHPDTTWAAALYNHHNRCLDWLAAAHAAANAIKAAWKASRQRRVVTLALCMSRLLPGGVSAIVVGFAR